MSTSSKHGNHDSSLSSEHRGLIRTGLRTTAAVLAASVLLTGCYVVPIQPQPSIYAPPPGAPAAAMPTSATYTARLYPLNDVAAQSGALQATVTDGLNGHGIFTLSFNGEALQGEASRVADGNPGFGRVHQQVYGAAPRYASSSRRGIASAAGPRGTYVNCEYALASAASGTGACLFSNGAKYQLHFGG